VLVGLNASIVHGKLEHLLGIEMQLQRTPNITEMDSSSIHTACDHILVASFDSKSNVLDNAGVRVGKTNIIRRRRLNLLFAGTDHGQHIHQNLGPHDRAAEEGTRAGVDHDRRQKPVLDRRLSLHTCSSAALLAIPHLPTKIPTSPLSPLHYALHAGISQRPHATISHAHSPRVSDKR